MCGSAAFASARSSRSSSTRSLFVPRCASACLSDIELPADSSAQIVSASLLGGKYLSIVPGGDEVVLADGGEIEFTQSAVNFEDLLGQFIFSQSSGE